MEQIEDYEEKLIEKYKSNNDNKLPRFLYHYTTQDGLLGIFNSSTIWATDILYLNDEVEFTYSAKMIEDEIKKTFKKSTDKKFNRLNKSLEKMLDRSRILDDFQIFVCSFSANGNLLSQWRGYCPENNGFSVGVDYSELKYAARHQNFISFYLLPCFYKREEQESIIQELKVEVLSNIMHCIKENRLDDLDKISDDYTRKFLILSAILKNKSFSEEQEWRAFCIKKNSDKYPQIQFRRGKSMVLPYLSIELQKSANNFPIKQVYIGPTPHIELSKRSVELFLKSKLLYCFVKDSEIPYRTW